MIIFMFSFVKYTLTYELNNRYYDKKSTNIVDNIEVLIKLVRVKLKRK